MRRRALGISLAAAMIAAPLVLGATLSGTLVSASAAKKPPSNPTTKIAGPQHWCGTNGVTCAEPATTWDEFAGYKQAIKNGAHISPYIGHDEPATLFYSNRPGSGNNVTY